MAKDIDFYFDIGSSYSYLAAEMMDAFVARTGATVHWRPFLLGAVFKATGNEPPAGRVAAKAAWLLTDMTRNAEYLGLQWKLPSRFPMVTLRAQRALVAAERLFGEAAIPRFARALFRAYWVDDRDPTANETILEAARSAELDGEKIVAALDEQATKDRLREITDAAVAKGAFGAPSFVVGEALFWGHDRLHLVEREIQKK